MAIRPGSSRALAALGLALSLGACGVSQTLSRPRVWPGSAATHPGRGAGHLSVARDTAALPLNLLIAQSDGHLVSISPRGQVVWRERQSDPGAVFVSRTGRTEIIAEPHESVIVLRRIDSGAVVYVYGRRGRPGRGADRLRDPQTALEDASGEVVIADAGNCRVLFVTPNAHRPSRTVESPNGCPTAAFPAQGHELVITEQQPAGILLLGGGAGPAARIALHGVAAPSDANAYAPDGVIVSDRTLPGRVVELDPHTGAVVWSYGPRSGAGELDRPSLARALPDGDVLVVDTGNDRVIVIDRASKAIVWQYGHAGVAASRPGYLDRPTSATLVPLGGV